MRTRPRQMVVAANAAVFDVAERHAAIKREAFLFGQRLNDELQPVILAIQQQQREEEEGREQGGDEYEHEDDGEGEVGLDGSPRSNNSNSKSNDNSNINNSSRNNKSASSIFSVSPRSLASSSTRRRKKARTPTAALKVEMRADTQKALADMLQARFFCVTRAFGGGWC
jgi:hypothetical protein